MNFIFMLTRADRTVDNCLDVLDEVLPLGLEHVGFKDVGVSAQVLGELTERIRRAGATSYMEVVSESRDACARSMRVALELGVDRLLGGTDFTAIKSMLQGSGTAYYPFAGYPVEHPTRLHGSADDIAAHCRTLMEHGATGVDLLAYRAIDADPMELVKVARRALGAGELIVAGSVVSCDQVRDLQKAGVDGFTIGTAVFDGTFVADSDGVAEQIRAILDCVN